MTEVLEGVRGELRGKVDEVGVLNIKLQCLLDEVGGGWVWLCSVGGLLDECVGVRMCSVGGFGFIRCVV